MQSDEFWQLFTPVRPKRLQRLRGMFLLQVLASRASSLREAGDLSPMQRICVGSPGLHDGWFIAARSCTEGSLAVPEARLCKGEVSGALEAEWVFCLLAGPPFNR